MKNIFLLGDSIRFGAPPNSPGYGVIVKEKLKGKANVLYPDANCRWTQHTLRFLHEWVADIECEKIDVVHWNNGLWDVHRIDGDEPLTTCDGYVEMLGRIHKRLVKTFPNAKIIFALTTAIIEQWDTENERIYNSDIRKYNDAAAKLMKSLNVEVNDLYTLTEDFGWTLHSDWIHFNKEGSQKIANKVIECIMEKDNVVLAK